MSAWFAVDTELRARAAKVTLLSRMILWIVFFVAAAAVAAIVLYGTMEIVSAKHFIVVRHALTQQHRVLGDGVQWVLPWERRVTLALPRGTRIRETREFPRDVRAVTEYRYDPQPYAVLTADQVEAYVDVWIQYAITDVGRAIDYPADFAVVLDDQVRPKTQELANEVKRWELSAVELSKRLAAVKWPEQNGLTVRHVGVQAVQFDDKMQAILRAQSAGLSAQAAVEHVQKMDMADALRHNKNAHVILGDGPRTSGLGIVHQ